MQQADIAAAAQQTMTAGLLAKALPINDSRPVNQFAQVLTLLRVAPFGMVMFTRKFDAIGGIVRRLDALLSTTFRRSAVSRGRC